MQNKTRSKTTSVEQSVPLSSVIFVRFRNRNLPQGSRSSLVSLRIILLRSGLVLHFIYLGRLMLIIIRNLRLPMLLYDSLSRPHKTSNGPTVEQSIFVVFVIFSFLL